MVLLFFQVFCVEFPRVLTPIRGSAGVLRLLSPEVTENGISLG